VISHALRTEHGRRGLALPAGRILCREACFSLDTRPAAVAYHRHFLAVRGRDNGRIQHNRPRRISTPTPHDPNIPALFHHRPWLRRPSRGGGLRKTQAHHRLRHQPAAHRGVGEGIDRTGEVAAAELKQPTSSTRVQSTIEESGFPYCGVPTPVDSANRPDLTPVLRASELSGRPQKGRDRGIRSTVYPGCTEEDCVSRAGEGLGPQVRRDFTVGYSPERINPGDREHRFATIQKVVSGQDGETLDTVAAVYGSVVKAGVYKASSIKVAEAAKVIENSQRDINIAFMNELARSSSAWHRTRMRCSTPREQSGNFLRFRPGLVGGIA